ncbi:MAG: hypothetical protein ABH857_03315 [Elusimicrobiota bacterium]
MKNRRIFSCLFNTVLFHRTVSFFILFTFLVTNFSAYSQADYSVFNLPNEYGRIVESFNGTSRNKIYLITSAHANLEVQKNIKHILEYLKSYYGKSFKYAGVEGSVGRLDPSILGGLGKNKKIILDYLLENGYIQGADYYALENPDKLVFEGLEDKEIYYRNLASLFKSIEFAENTGAKRQKLRKILSDVKPKLYPNKLSNFENIEKKYKTGELPLINYLKELFRYAEIFNIEIRSKYPECFNLIYTSNINNKINILMLSEEVRDLTYDVKLKLTNNIDISKKVLYCDRYLDLYSDYITNNASARGMELWKESDKFYKELTELFGKISYLNYAKSYLEDFNNAEKNMNTFYSLALKRNEIMTSKMLNYVIPAEAGILAGYSSIKDSRVRPECDKVAAMIIGGFHINGITNILRAEGISFEVIRPNISKSITKEIYKERIMDWAECMNIETSAGIIMPAINTIPNNFLEFPSILDTGLPNEERVRVFEQICKRLDERADLTRAKRKLIAKCFKQNIQLVSEDAMPIEKMEEENDGSVEEIILSIINNKYGYFSKMVKQSQSSLKDTASENLGLMRGVLADEGVSFANLDYVKDFGGLTGFLSSCPWFILFLNREIIYFKKTENMSEGTSQSLRRKRKHNDIFGNSFAEYNSELKSFEKVIDMAGLLQNANIKILAPFDKSGKRIRLQEDYSPDSSAQYPTASDDVLPRESREMLLEGDLPEDLFDTRSSAIESENERLESAQEIDDEFVSVGKVPAEESEESEVEYFREDPDDPIEEFPSDEEMYGLITGEDKRDNLYREMDLLSQEDTKLAKEIFDEASGEIQDELTKRINITNNTLEKLNIFMDATQRTVKALKISFDFNVGDIKPLLLHYSEMGNYILGWMPADMAGRTEIENIQARLGNIVNQSSVSDIVLEIRTVTELIMSLREPLYEVMDKNNAKKRESYLKLIAYETAKKEEEAWRDLYNSYSYYSDAPKEIGIIERAIDNIKPSINAARVGGNKAEYEYWVGQHTQKQKEKKELYDYISKCEKAGYLGDKLVTVRTLCLQLIEETALDHVISKNINAKAKKRFETANVKDLKLDNVRRIYEELKLYNQNQETNNRKFDEISAKNRCLNAALEARAHIIRMLCMEDLTEDKIAQEKIEFARIHDSMPQAFGLFGDVYSNYWSDFNNLINDRRNKSIFRNREAYLKGKGLDPKGIYRFNYNGAVCLIPYRKILGSAKWFTIFYKQSVYRRVLPEKEYEMIPVENMETALGYLLVEAINIGAADLVNDRKSDMLTDKILTRHTYPAVPFIGEFIKDMYAKKGEEFIRKMIAPAIKEVFGNGVRGSESDMMSAFLRRFSDIAFEQLSHWKLENAKPVNRKWILFEERGDYYFLKPIDDSGSEKSDSPGYLDSLNYSSDEEVSRQPRSGEESRDALNSCAKYAPGTATYTQLREASGETSYFQGNVGKYGVSPQSRDSIIGRVEKLSPQTKRHSKFSRSPEVYNTMDTTLTSPQGRGRPTPPRKRPVKRMKTVEEHLKELHAQKRFDLLIWFDEREWIRKESFVSRIKHRVEVSRRNNKRRNKKKTIKDSGYLSDNKISKKNEEEDFEASFNSLSDTETEDGRLDSGLPNAIIALYRAFANIYSSTAGDADEKNILDVMKAYANSRYGLKYYILSQEKKLRSDANIDFYSAPAWCEMIGDEHRFCIQHDALTALAHIKRLFEVIGLDINIDLYSAALVDFSVKFYNIKKQHKTGNGNDGSIKDKAIESINMQGFAEFHELISISMRLQSIKDISAADKLNELQNMMHRMAEILNISEDKQDIFYFDLMRQYKHLGKAYARYERNHNKIVCSTYYVSLNDIDELGINGLLFKMGIIGIEEGGENVLVEEGRLNIVFTGDFPNYKNHDFVKSEIDVMNRLQGFLCFENMGQVSWNMGPVSESMISDLMFLLDSGIRVSTGENKEMCSDSRYQVEMVYLTGLMTKKTKNLNITQEEENIELISIPKMPDLALSKIYGFIFDISWQVFHQMKGVLGEVAQYNHFEICGWVTNMILEAEMYSWMDNPLEYFDCGSPELHKCMITAV